MGSFDSFHFDTIHVTLKIINSEYPNEPAHIFTDCFNGLYVIKTQIKHLTVHNSHPDKTILQEIVELLQQRFQPITLYKVRTHANIEGNEKAYELAKEGREKEHIDAINPHKFAHSTPYYYQKIGSTLWMKHRTKVQLDFLKNISLNMIENII